MGKRKGKKPGMRISLLDTAAFANLIFQFGEPYREALTALARGDFQAAVAGFQSAAANKEAGSFKNVMQAVGPLVGVRIAKRIIQAVSGGRTPGISWGSRRRITGVGL